MAMGSHCHHRCNPEPCQSSLPPLRWTARPLPCPRCQSRTVGPCGLSHAQPSLQRSRCKGQGSTRTCNALTGTL
jgi:hypothetical protein